MWLRITRMTFVDGKLVGEGKEGNFPEKTARDLIAAHKAVEIEEPKKEKKAKD